MKQEQYVYRNLPIPGGGYVTGFHFHEKEPGLLYCRTDIGGTYRFEAACGRWKSLIDHVTMEDLSETFPIALALDPEDADRLYIVCGVNRSGSGKIAVSGDRGEHFTYYNMPLMAHGNLNGRGTGNRLIVDRRDSACLYYASQQEGLWRSSDRGASWEKLEAFPEEYLTFVGQSPDGKALFVAGAGVTTARTEHLRGHSFYVSYDNGASFEPLWQPEDGEIEGVRLAGLIAQRYAVDADYLYVTYSVMGRNAYVLENGYSCDGGSVIGGRVVRYPLRDGRIGAGEDITPSAGNVSAALWEKVHRDPVNKDPDKTGSAADFREYGFSGIAVTPAAPGLLACSTICKGDGDVIFRSGDSGQTWEPVLYDLAVGEMAFRTSYMKPCYNGGHSLIHWLTDLKINPFDPGELWFNTGTGVFCTGNFTEDRVVFSDHSDGIEETVHLNVYSPPAGEVQLIDILGDLGGFAFRDVDKACDNSFADGDGNRYITCINADYSDRDPNYGVITPRGNWTGRTKGGLIVTSDNFRTFRRLPQPFGITEDLDEALHRIETPNVNSGWVAMSPDAVHIVWSVAENIELPVNRVIVSHDGGASFAQAVVYNGDGTRKTEGGFKVFSDRVDSALFYGFGDHSDLYVSADGGASFWQKSVEAVDRDGGSCVFPSVNFTLIDCADKTEVRGESGKTGVFYMALAQHGLWKLVYDREQDRVRVVRLSREGDVFYRIGLGLLAPGADYLRDAKALYVAAVLDGVYGFYRSVDEGESFTRLNTDRQMFGEINSIDADSRIYGRFYLATGSRGVIYGEPDRQE